MKSRAAGWTCARRSSSSIGTARRAAEISSRLVARIRCRMSATSKSGLGAELVRRRDELIELCLRLAARDHLARALDAFLDRLGPPGDIDRSACVQQHDVQRRTWLVLEDCKNARLRFVDRVDPDRAPVVYLEAELRRVNLVLADLAVCELGNESRSGDRDLVQTL